MSEEKKIKDLNLDSFLKNDEDHKVKVSEIVDEPIIDSEYNQDISNYKPKDNLVNNWKYLKSLGLSEREIQKRIDEE